MKDEIELNNGIVPKYFSEIQKHDINKKERDADN